MIRLFFTKVAKDDSNKNIQVQPNQNKEAMEANIKTKRCPKCGRVLTVDNFNKSNTVKSGLQSRCRECQIADNKAQYLKRKAAAMKRKSVVAVTPPANRNPKLSDFQPRELIAELHALGYRGKLYITREVVV